MSSRPEILRSKEAGCRWAAGLAAREDTRCLFERLADQYRDLAHELELIEKLRAQPRAVRQPLAQKRPKPAKIRARLTVAAAAASKQPKPAVSFRMEPRHKMTERHVQAARRIVERQRHLIAEQQALGHSTNKSEALLATFEQSLATFEDELALRRR